VPLLNYDLAYGGRAAQAHEKEHWVVVAKRGVSSAKLEELCKSVKGCERVGHPSEGGVPFFEVHSTEQELEQVLALAPGQMEFAEPDGMFYLDPEESEEPAQSKSWGLDRVDAPNRFADGTGAHIYVLDTGIRISHNDFTSRASAAIDLTSNTLKECNGEANCGNDAQGTEPIAQALPEVWSTVLPPRQRSTLARCSAIRAAALGLGRMTPWIGSPRNRRDQLFRA